jgi:flagellar hook assembly protein FlgD
MGVADVNDPRTVRPYSFRIDTLKRQRAGAIILSNVINPAAGGKTTFQYTLASAGRVTIQVFTMSGDIVQVLCAATEAAGEYKITWDGRNRSGQMVARGLYFIRAVGPDLDEIRKVLVVR